MGIIVENGGILTTVQDEGRFGYQAFGVSTSGAMAMNSRCIGQFWGKKGRRFPLQEQEMDAVDILHLQEVWIFRS